MATLYYWNDLVQNVSIISIAGENYLVRSIEFVNRFGEEQVRLLLHNKLSDTNEYRYFRKSDSFALINPTGRVIDPSKINAEYLQGYIPSDFALEDHTHTADQVSNLSSYLSGYLESEGYEPASNNTSNVDLSAYYTKTNLQTGGQAQVHINNLTNEPGNQYEVIFRSASGLTTDSDFSYQNDTLFIKNSNVSTNLSLSNGVRFKSGSYLGKLNTSTLSGTTGWVLPNASGTLALTDVDNHFSSLQSFDSGLKVSNTSLAISFSGNDVAGISWKFANAFSLVSQGEEKLIVYPSNVTCNANFVSGVGLFQNIETRNFEIDNDGLGNRARFITTSLSNPRNYTLPDVTGVFALLDDIPIVGTDVQAYHSGLQSLSNTCDISYSNSFPYFSGNNVFSLANLSSFGRSFVALEAASNARSALQLGEFATTNFSNNVTVSGNWDFSAGETKLGIVEGTPAFQNGFTSAGPGSVLQLFRIFTGGSGIANISSSGLTAQREFTFPDSSGTLALSSAIPSGDFATTDYSDNVTVSGAWDFQNDVTVSASSGNRFVNIENTSTTATSGIRCENDAGENISFLVRGSAYPPAWGTNKGTIGVSTGLAGLLIFTQTSSQDIEFALGGVSTTDITFEGSTGNAIFGNDVEVQGEMKGSKIALPFGESSTVSSGTSYMKTVNGLQMSASRGYVMNRAGSILGGSVQFNITAYSSSGLLTFTIYKNGVTLATLQSGAISSTGVRSWHNTFSRGTYAYAAGDIISIAVTHVSGTYTSDDFCGFLEFIQDT